MASEELAKKSKDRFYRGKNIDDLKKVDVREFSKLVKSRTRRTILRNYDVIDAFLRKCDERTLKNRPIRTHDRSIVVVPRMIGKTIGIHNGKEFVKVLIIEEMLGHRLGELAMTRRIAKHTSVGGGAKKKKV